MNFMKKLAQLGLTDRERRDSAYMDEVMQAALRLGIDHQRAFHLMGALARVVAKSNAKRGKVPFAQVRAEMLLLFTDGLDDNEETIAIVDDEATH